LKGDGSKASVLGACTTFANGGGTWAVEKAWVDETAPPAQAARVACHGVCATGKAADTLPDAPFLLRSLEPLRAVRIAPPTDRPAGVTDVKLFRVKVVGGDGRDGLCIRAGR
jgi:hypothetical protein